MKLVVRRWVKSVVRRFAVCSLLCAAVLPHPAVAQGALPPLRLGAVPLGSADDTVRQFKPLATYLAGLLGQPVEFQYLSGHEQVLDALRQGYLALAYLGPAPYAELVGSGVGQLPPGQIRPLVRFKESDGQAQYRCVLVAFPDDKVSLGPRSRLSVGMPNALSTCGPLAVKVMLAQSGVGWQQVVPHYMGHHDRVARAVVAGTVQLGGVREEVAIRHSGLGLQVVARTDPLPGFVLVGHAGLLSQRAMAQLAKLPDTPASEYSKWGGVLRHGLVPASDADFDVVRSIVQKVRRP